MRLFKSTFLLILALCGFCFAELANPFAPRDTVLLMAVGDIMFDRNVRNYQRARAWHYPFYNIIPSLQDADFLTGNLESVISDKGVREDKLYSFRGDVEQMRLLEFAGFDCLTLGNNHAFDYGTVAFLDCIRRLNSANITPVGGGRNHSEAIAPKFFNVKGTIVGVMGLNDTRTNFYRPELPATVPTWGPSWVQSNVLLHISNAKKRCDILMVHIHWGDEDTTLPNENQIRLGRSIIDAGADVVLGHHPHRLQPIEFYKGYDGEGIIAYSLANFLFDQNDYLNNLSGILRLFVSGEDIIRVELQPIEMLSAPRATSPARGQHFEDVHQLMKSICDIFGTDVKVGSDSMLVFTKKSVEAEIE